MSASCLYPGPLSDCLLAADRTQNRKLVKYLLTREKIVETDSPVPSYLPGVDRDGQVAAKAEGSHTIYSISIVLVHTYS